MEYLFLAGRVIYGGFFILSGIDHFRYVAMMTPYAAAKGVPASVSKPMVYASGAMIILGGLSFLLGYRPTLGVLLVTLFLIPVTFMMHNYWADADPQMKQFNQVQFRKNLALLGAAWMLLAIPQPWPLSLG